MRPIPITEVMRDPNLFGKWFEGPSWATWESVLKAAYGLPMSRDDIIGFQAVAGGRDPPRQRVEQLLAIVGRRGGKDSIASLITAYSAVFENFQPRLRAGERARCIHLGVDRAQARLSHRYTSAYFNQVELLKPLIISDRDGELLELTNGAEIVISTNSYRSVRGPSYLSAVLTECCFYRDENFATPDTELVEALLPGMATLHDLAMLVGISTPYMRSGWACETWERHFGKDSDDILVVHGPSTQFNPTLNPRIIENALARDPERAKAEWLAQWRDAETSFLPVELILSAVDIDITVRPPDPKHQYIGFVDAAGGAGTDSFTAAICHEQDSTVILDAVFEKIPPFSPVATVAEISKLMREYRVYKVVGDRYAGSWPAEQFVANGIQYEESDKSRSEIYQAVIPLFTSGRVRLLDNKKLVDQFAGLRRKVQLGGREQIDHGPGQHSHDDLSNTGAGAIALAGAGDDRLSVIRRYLLGNAA